LFVLIGGVLQVSRARDFFLGVGKLAGRRLAGGPALTAVVSSGLMGSVSGSSMANVAITGSFTIPMMKKVGYQPYQAGAIEAGASTGGQIMPPVMGAAAFAMAGLLGVPYWNIVVAAVVPAILYFIAVGAYAQFQGAKLGVASTQGKVELKQLLLDAPLFLAPFLVLIVLLSQGYSPMFSIFWGILGVVITAVALGLVTKQWVPVKQWLDAIAAGAKTGAGIAATSAAIGLVMSTLTMTGLGIKLPSMVIEFSGGNLVIALIITMVAAIVLGMGVPTLAAYILAALVCAPALYQLGVSLFAAHLFVLFFAVFSCVTPPVAVAALVASSIAGSSYLRTALETVKVCLAGFLLPYIMIFAPGIIMQNPSVASTVLAIVISLISFISAASAIVGYGIAPLSLAERVMIGAVSILLLAYLLTKFLPLLFVGLVIFITVGFLQWRKQKYTRRKEPLGLA
jgi:TRAP transporter 4TM/12TM fusion protein